VLNEDKRIDPEDGSSVTSGLPSPMGRGLRALANGVSLGEKGEGMGPPLGGGLRGVK
jgi:hypothetical protein